METDELIQRLAQQNSPVRPLPSPWTRVALWLAIALPSMAVIVFAMSPRSDLAAKAMDLRFVIEQFGALATGVAAAAAAFASTIPGLDRRLLLVPIAPLALWLGSLGQGCVQDWVQRGAAGLSLQPDWICFPAIILVGAIPGVAMAVMLRRGAPLTPHITAALGGLAAAGLGNFGLRLFHVQDASIMVLVWQVGTVMVLSALAGSVGHYLLNWSAVLRTR